MSARFEQQRAWPTARLAASCLCAEVLCGSSGPAACSRHRRHRRYACRSLSITSIHLWLKGLKASLDIINQDVQS